MSSISFSADDATRPPPSCLDGGGVTTDSACDRMQDFDIVRYPRTCGADFRSSPLDLCFRGRAWAGWVFATAVVIWLLPRLGFASEVLEQKFDGVVKPRLWVQVVPQVDGVIRRILFTPGQRVSKGDILFEMDPDDFAIDVRIAQAELDESRAHLTVAEDAASRQAELIKQNSTARQVARQSEIEVEIARAHVAHNEGALAP